jgi:hypothetical protein
MGQAEIDARVNAFETTLFSHGSMIEGQQTIERLIRRWRTADDARPETHALMILGDARNGKTSILKRVASANPPYERDHTTIRPVVCFDAPKRTVPKQFAMAMFRAMKPGYSLKSGATASDILAEIATLADAMCTRVFLVDEAHHIVDHKSDDAIEDIAEHIKLYLNQCGTQLVLSGLPHLARLPKTKKLDQYTGRFEGQVWVRPYDWSSRSGRAKFLAMLGKFEKQISLQEPSNLKEFDIASRIYCASGGAIGIVSKHLGRALRHALEGGREVVTLVDLGRAYAGTLIEYRPPRQLADFDADFLTEIEEFPAARNPYLAKGNDFRVLWREMAGDRLVDQSRITPHKTRPPAKLDAFGRAA